MAFASEDRFYCGLCGCEQPLFSATLLNNCACLFCGNCLSRYVAQQLENLTELLSRTSFLQQYVPNRKGIYIDDDGATQDVKIVSARFGTNWRDSEVTLKLPDGQQCRAPYWRLRSATVDCPSSGFTPLVCPGEDCPGLITKSEAQEICPFDFELLLEQETLMMAQISGSVHCPECQFLIQCVHAEGSRAPLLGEAHEQHYRFRCPICQKDFCGVCLATPYHRGVNCRQSQAPDCRFCPSKVEPLQSPSEMRSTSHLKQSVRRAGVDAGWCSERGDLLWVAEQIHKVCHAAECRVLLKNSCTRRLPCGHSCCGVRGPVNASSSSHSCLPCFEPDCPHGRVDADNCQICWESFRDGPCIQFPCGHYIHLECARARLVQGYPGPSITFNHLYCALCGAGDWAQQPGGSSWPMNHPLLRKEIAPILKLHERTVALAMTRLKASNALNSEALQPGGQFHSRPVDYAMTIYTFYLCYQCKQPYCGGRRDCQAAEDAAEFDPKELVCGSCCAMAAGKNCPRHGTRFIEWKCRYCCRVASWYCFGTTHFCDACHRGQARHRQPCPGARCPLKIDHPQPGVEFCLGCSICRHRDD